MDENLKIKIEQAQNGNKTALDELAKDNRGLIISIAKRFLNRGYELDDIIQIGYIGFIKAIKKFDFTYNVALSTYAVAYVIGEIKRFFRDDGPIKVSRQLKYLYIQIKNEQEKNENITIEELSSKLKISKDEIVLAINSYITPESLEGKIEEDSKNILERIPNKDGNEENIINNIMLKQAIEKLNSREQKIICLRYYKGLTQKKISEALNISQVQVSRIEKNVLQKIAEELK